MNGTDKRPIEDKAFWVFWKEQIEPKGVELKADEIAEMRNPNDPPDFRFEYQGKRIGVEHTQVFQKGDLTPQHDKAIEARLCAELENRLQKKQCLSPGIITLRFMNLREVKKLEERQLVDELCDIISRILMANPRFHGELIPRAARQQLKWVRVATYFPFGTLIRVLAARSGWVDEWCLPIFQEAATKKARDLPRYAGNYDECWLLLSSSMSHQGEFLEPDNMACQTGITCPFNRVFFIQTVPPRCYKIAVTKA